MPSLYVFDLDGTLVDSSGTTLNVINKLRARLGKPAIDKRHILGHLSSGGLQIVEHGIDLPRGSWNLDYLAQFREIYRADDLENEHLYEGAVEFVNHVKRSGAKTALCTNKPRDLVTKVLTHHQMVALFDVEVTLGDVVYPKPHPGGLTSILSKLEISKQQVVFCGDSTADQIAAERAGVPFWFHQVGYDDGVNAEQAEVVFRNYYELF
jgi:HAD superfamily hydrolase (TIGR01509 family)